VSAQAAPAMRPLLVLSAFTFTSVIGVRVTTALAALHAGLSPALIGPMIALFALMPMLLGVRLGKLIDRIGVRRPLTAGALLAALGAAACAAWPHPLMLAAMAVMIGLSHLAFSLGTQHAAGELGGPAHRAANFNLLTMAFSCSGLMGPPLAGLVIDHFGHRAAFAVMSVLALAVTIGCRLFPFERHLPPADARAGAAGGSTDGGSAAGHATAGGSGATPAPAHAPPRGWRASLALLGDTRFRQLLLALLVVSAAWEAFQFLIPLHAHAIGLNASSVGLAIASFSAGSLSIRLLMSRLLPRLGSHQWLMLALGLCVAGYALLPFSSALPALMAMSFLLGVGPGIGLPLTMAALHGASPAGRVGEAAGLRITLQSFQQILLPVVVGALAALLGVQPLFWLYSVVALAVALSIRHAR
jgi:MFS family permease